MKEKTKEKLGMAVLILATLLIGLLLFVRHWQFELPLYPNVDELLSLDCIYDLLNQHIYAGDIYVLDFFRYPHLTFYYAVVGVRILRKLLSGTDTAILIRYCICGTALVSNVCIYFAVKIMTEKRRWAYIAFLLSIFSLYGYSYLFYTGPDTMLYAVANVILLLGCVIYRDWQEDRVVYLWYPLMAVCIGLAVAAKVHGIFFGLFWLALHIRKKYWKSHRDNFLFVLNCIILALVFCICNYSLFFHFKTFIGDNLYNLQHYAWGHPGIEHNLPLLGYTEAYVFTAYGAVGGLLFILGIVRLVWEKDWQQLIVFLLMPVVILLMLSRYSIMLGRNVSLIVPFAVLFMTYGLMEIERWLERYLSGKKKTSKKDKAKKQLAVMPKYIIDAAVALMILCNAAAVCNNYRYELSYNDAAAYIEEQIPEGATIYCTSYAPDMDAEKYNIIDIEEDISKLPEQLGENEYYVDVQYATGYFSQQKDYLVRQGCDMYPDLKKSYEDKVGQYTLLKQYQGITYGKEWKYRAGYLDFARFDPDDYYIGPTIGIYGK
jgi:hypothetical protein